MIKNKINSKIISEFQSLQSKEIKGASKLTAIDALRSLEKEIHALLDSGWPRDSVIAEIKNKLNIEITPRTFNAYWAQIQRESKANHISDGEVVSLKHEIECLNTEIDRLNLQLKLAFKKLSHNERIEIEERSGSEELSSIATDGVSSVKPKNHDLKPFSKEKGDTSDVRKSVNCKESDL
ncbi:hypothetical protein [Endozoicomonas ascidiicola]|uniref:hypothetical protein n=1 Tax=Endozoicomonas ascidiicola TaxID=1698521 RepID=UPI000832E8F1|nr:hypothetical protein [Endozoicomonas ascidiicola]